MKNDLLARCGVAGLCLLLLFTPVVLPQEAKKDGADKTKWDVLNPPFHLNTVRIKTDETTWSSLDVSPDGKSFVFDMLGDIYVSDIGGGNARALTEDFGWNIQPKFSPDGKQIAFVSDRGGLTNLWVMNADGTGLKQLSDEKKNIIHSPAWSPDGEYIAVMKGIMSSRSIPAGEIWFYHKSGGSGIVVRPRKNGRRDQKNIADPAFSPDGKYLYYTEDITPGPIFQYNRDPLKSIFAITRYKLEDGETDRFVSGVGGAIVPTPSPDGKYLAFIRRIREKTALFLKDLTTGEETPIFAGLERDMQEGFGSEGYYASIDWMPDSGSIVFWAGGHFHRINVASKKVATIPVRVETDKQYADALRFPVNVSPDKFNVKMVRWAQRSPDGRSVLFQALGKLWVKDIQSGRFKRLTNHEDFDEYYPRYSIDGSRIVFTTWDDDALGSVRMVNADGSDERVVTNEPGHYIEPSFSPDGGKIVYRKFAGGFILSPKYGMASGIYVADLKTGENTRVHRGGSDPQFAGDDSRVYFTEGVPGKDYPETRVSSVDLNGRDKRVHLYGADHVEEYRISPDGNWVAFTSQYNAYLIPFPKTGKMIKVGPREKSLPVKKISSRAGENLLWRGNSGSVGWTHGPVYYERALNEAFDFIPGAPDKLPEPVDSGVDLSFAVDTDKPTGYKAIVGGTVVTMRDANNTREVINDGIVLINGNRIERVGKRGSVQIPKGAMVIDAKGKTVIPGLVDVHAHGPQGENQIIPQQNWQMYANLAFGVTTTHDPSNDTQEIFSAAEMQKAGMIVAPRIYSTGRILYGAEAVGAKAIVNSYEDALFHVRRMKDSGAISVKSYNQPGRVQRQQILQAARELGMMVVPEGGGKFQQNMTMVVDGHTGLEHAIPIATGYSDVTQLWSATKSEYTPTFVVAYGGLMGEEYWYDRTEVWKNPRLLRYTPEYLLDSRAIRRQEAPDNQYNHIDVAKYAKTLRDKGVLIHIGAHGQRAGLAAHWELWIMAQGGFTPWEALRSGTIDGAHYVGMDKDIGSIEPGKLADLVIIDGDVLSDIRRSEFVTYTVLNGRVYEAATMNEMGGKKRREFFFEKMRDSFLPDETRQAMDEKAFEHRWVH